MSYVLHRNSNDCEIIGTTVILVVSYTLLESPKGETMGIASLYEI
jgi:hypothetical protein